MNTPSLSNVKKKKVIFLIFSCILYFLSIRFSLTFLHDPAGISMVWFASGIGLALFLVNTYFRKIILISVFYISGVLAQLSFGRPLSLALGFMFANVFETVISAWIIVCIVGCKNIKFIKVKEIAAFIFAVFFGNFFSSALAAFISKIINQDEFFETLKTWWIVDGLGMMILTPLIVSLSNIKVKKIKVNYYYAFELLCYFVALLICNYFLFIETNYAYLFRPYILIGFVAWAALRFNMLILSMTLLGATLLALTGNVENYALFWGNISGKSAPLLSLQIFFLFISSIGYLLLAAHTEAMTAKKNAENLAERLSIISERLSLATSAAALGIWDWNIKENTMWWDERMLELYGLTQETFSGGIEAWQNGLHPEDRDATLAECQAALRGEKGWDTSFRVLHPNGTVRVLKANGIVFRDSNGDVVRMLGINADITDLKQKEEELTLSKQLAEDSSKAKSNFLAKMSHEIRTPMHTIIGYSQVLVETKVSPEEQKNYIDIIMNNGWHLISLIDEILDMSKIETGKMSVDKEYFLILPLVEEVMESLEIRAKSLEIDLILEAYEVVPEIIFSDSTKIKQLLYNLINNSLKFTHKNGKIFLSLKHYNNNNILEFTVKDTGIGIPILEREKIFEAFHQVKMEDSGLTKGVGLGLSISKQICKILGGDLVLKESELGKGSVFVATVSTV